MGGAVSRIDLHEGSSEFHFESGGRDFIAGVITAGASDGHTKNCPSGRRQNRSCLVVTGRSRRRSKHYSRRKVIPKSFRRSTAVGALPGTIDHTVPPGACTVHRVSRTTEEMKDEQITDFLTSVRTTVPGDATWIRIEGTPDAAVLSMLGRDFDIHVLSLEDVANTHQRSKVEDYGNYLFIVARIPDFEEGGMLVSEQLSMFLGHGFLVTINEHPGRLDPIRDRVFAGHTRIRELRADYLAYTILDTVTDHYFPVIETIGSRLNALDDLIEAAVNHEQRAEIRALRGNLLLLRRFIWPQRDALAALMREHGDLISSATQTYLRDCYDHTVQILEITETYRELCADLRDFHLSEISFRNNEIMKTLTIIATLFMPLSFLAGFYGMNFQHMPELSSPNGYPAVIAIMVTVATGLLFWFYRKGWLP